MKEATHLNVTNAWESNTCKGYQIHHCHGNIYLSYVMLFMLPKATTNLFASESQAVRR